jgi:hypothetical protein
MQPSSRADIPDGAREAAAISLSGMHRVEWRAADDGIRTTYRRMADRALTAAMPHLTVPKDEHG